MKHQRSGLPVHVGRLLRQLRRSIRLYVWLEGVAAMVVLIATAFWLGLILDWVLEPSKAIRLAGIVLVSGLLLALFYRIVLRRAFVPMTDANMALLIERCFDRLDGALLTSVDMEENPCHSTTYHHQMRRRTDQKTARLTQNLRLRGVLNLAPLLRLSSCALALVLSMAVFGIFAQDTAGFWLERLWLTDQLWPRQVRLVVEGFTAHEADQRIEKVARQSDYDVIVKADITSGHVAPHQVILRFQGEDGSRGHHVMTRVGEAILGRDTYQQYRYTFKDITRPFSLAVVGGDDRVEGLRFHVVDRPELVGMELDCEYPNYMGRAPRHLKVSSTTQIPEGTRLTIHGEANKELAKVTVQSADEEPPSVIMPHTPTRFTWRLSEINSDETLWFSLQTEDGINSRQPYRLSLELVPDEPPEVLVNTNGIGQAITPGAILPVEGKITDDYGVDRVWFEYRVNVGEATTVPFPSVESGKNEIEIKRALDTREFPDTHQLHPGEKLIVSVKATDHYDLGSFSHVGRSQRFLYDVVTPEQLRSLLEHRELMLRRRYENTRQEMVDTRDLLARVETRIHQGSAPANPAGNTKRLGDTPQPAARREESSRDDPWSKRAMYRRELRLVRAIQNLQRIAHETLSVAASFENIRAELIHNRIDTQTLKQRIQNDIAIPLQNLGSQQLPDLAHRLEGLTKQTAQPNALAKPLKWAIVQADDVLVEMRAILDKMLELESYYEVLKIFRKIIEDQETLRVKTLQRRQQQLRNFFNE